MASFYLCRDNRRSLYLSWYLFLSGSLEEARLIYRVLACGFHQTAMIISQHHFLDVVFWIIICVMIYIWH